jgi:hypothetical protein
MRPTPSPSLVPGFDATTYLVLDDLGKLGQTYREADAEKADKETVIQDMLGGQYNQPVRIIAFNTAEGWASDVSEDIAREVLARAAAELSPLPTGTKWFVEMQLGERVRP